MMQADQRIQSPVGRRCKAGFESLEFGVAQVAADLAGGLGVQQDKLPCPDADFSRQPLGSRDFKHNVAQIVVPRQPVVCAGERIEIRDKTPIRVAGARVRQIARSEQHIRCSVLVFDQFYNDLQRVIGIQSQQLTARIGFEVGIRDLQDPDRVSRRAQPCAIATHRGHFRSAAQACSAPGLRVDV